MANDTQNNQTNSNDISLGSAIMHLLAWTTIGGVLGALIGAVLLGEYGETEEITKLNNDNVPITSKQYTDESMHLYFITPVVGGFAGGLLLTALTLMFVTTYQSELAAKVRKGINASTDSVKRLFCNSFRALKNENMSLNDNSDPTKRNATGCSNDK